MHQKETKKNLDRSMRQPMRNSCTPRKCSCSCPHHFPTLIPNLLPHVGWAIVGSQCIRCMSNLLNEAPKVRIKLWKTAAYFTYNSIELTNPHRGSFFLIYFCDIPIEILLFLAVSSGRRPCVNFFTLASNFLTTIVFTLWFLDNR